MTPETAGMLRHYPDHSSYLAHQNSKQCWELAIDHARKGWLLRGKDYPQTEAERVFLDWEIR